MSELREVLILLKACGHDVLGMPCICSTPEMHSDECVNLRKATIIVGNLAAQPAIVIGELEEDSDTGEVPNA